MNNVTIGKVNDIKGFFNTYHELKADNFNSLFGNATESDIMTLDYCLSDLYGSRYLQSRFTDIFNNQSANNCIARIVILADKLYFENWLNTKQTIEKALLTDLDKPLTSEKTGENTTENKVNAFDSETASDSDNSTHNYSETTQYSNGKTATQNAKTQIDFTRNNDFLEIIINDILSMCCLSIYDDSYTPCHNSSGGGGSDPELESRVTQCETDITDIKKLIPATATEQNKLATIADVQSGYDDTELREKIEENTEDIQGIYDDLTDYATKTELQAVENQIPDVSGLATKTELQAVESQIPDVSGLATKTEVQAITDLIPSNASTQNKLATMADIGGGGSSIGFVKSSQYPIAFTEVLQGLGLTTSDLPLVLKIDFAGTYNNNNSYDSCIFELNSVMDTGGLNIIHEMAKSSSVKFWKYANSVAVSGTSNDNVYGNGLYCFSAFKA